VVHEAPPDNARFSVRSRAILKSAFVTTHFTSTNETLLLQANFLRGMVGHDPSLTLHNQIPGSLGPNEIVMTVLPTPNHDQTVSRDNGLSHVVAAADGFDLPASPSV